MSSSTVSFRDSRQFIQGWTLQELLALQVIRFYSITQDKIRTKDNLSDQIADFTGIPISVLQGKDFADCSLVERMSQVSKRSTTRAEDIAYYLIGLFSINITLLYREGSLKAFIRLQKKIIRTLKEDYILFAQRLYRPKAKGLLVNSPADFCLKNCCTCLQDRGFKYSGLVRVYYITGYIRDLLSLTSYRLCINLGLEKQTTLLLSSISRVLASLNLVIYYPDNLERDKILYMFLELYQYIPEKYFRRDLQIRLSKFLNQGSYKIYMYQEIPRASATTL